MNFRQPLLGLCTLGCGLLVILSIAPLARAANASIPPEIKTSPDAANNRALVDAYIKGQIDQMSAPATLHDAREFLIGQVVNTGGGQPLSGQFLDVYAQELNQQLTPLLANQDQAQQTIRLNVAIVVAGVAAKVDNVRLMPITLLLLNDKSDAVKIWALRAARFVLPPAISINQQAKLLAAIKALADPNANPMLLQLVYEALSPPPATIAANQPNAPKIVSVVVPELQNLLAARVEQLRSQVPPDVLSVVPATSFLGSAAWDQCTPAQQLKTVQIISDMLAVAGERADASNGIDKDQMIQVVKGVSLALEAAALKAHANDLFSSLQHQLAINPGMPNVAAVTAKAHPLLIMFPAWHSLAAPPHILPGGSASTTAPATGAATAPITASK